MIERLGLFLPFLAVLEFGLMEVGALFGLGFADAHRDAVVLALFLRVAVAQLRGIERLDEERDAQSVLVERTPEAFERAAARGACGDDCAKVAETGIGLATVDAQLIGKCRGHAVANKVSCGARIGKGIPTGE